MLAIFKKELVKPPQELNSPASLASSRKPKLAPEILKDFESANPSNTFSVSFGDVASLAYIPPQNPYSIHQRYIYTRELYQDVNFWIFQVCTFSELFRVTEIFRTVLLSIVWCCCIAGCSVDWMTYTAFSSEAWTTYAASIDSMGYQRAPTKPCWWLKLTGLYVIVVHTQPTKSSRILMALSDSSSMTPKLAMSLPPW